MSRVVFACQPAAPDVAPTRADVACFVGLVRVLAGAAVSPDVSGWLKSQGYKADQIALLTQIPLPLENYSAFTAMFDPGGSTQSEGTDYLAAAVRSFFAQGGKLCYVVRTGEPLSVSDGATEKAARLAGILPNSSLAPDDAKTWTGVSTLTVLTEVSFLCTPDLPALSASQPQGVQGQTPDVVSGPEQFVVCTQVDITPRQQRTYEAPAPRLTSGDYTAWASSVASIVNYLASGTVKHQPHLREVQYVAAFPLPQEQGAAAHAENELTDEMSQDVHAVMKQVMPETPPPGGNVVMGNISSAFLQLAYPWLKTSGSGVLLESLEPADGVLTGMLARNALTRGTFTSATKIAPAELYDVWPDLPAQEYKSSETALKWAPGSPQKALIERMSLFGMTPAGWALKSDVTAYPGETYRSAPVNRLVSVIYRAARHMGEAMVFRVNGPALWGRVTRFLQNLMTRLWHLHALDGDSVDQAFGVRCDRSTMTQNDLDNGRMVAEVTFTAPAMVETIRVQMAFEASGTSTQEIAANLAEAS